MDAKLIEQATRMLLEGLAEKDREGIADTPQRVAKSYMEMFERPEFNMTTFEANGYDQMILERDIQFHTLCEHHILPFFGSVSIGYIPNDKIIGISKLPRMVEYYSAGLNTQEYFTSNIARRLWSALQPVGVAVLVKGRHLCQEMRGVKKEGEMITSEMMGAFRDDGKAREEFLCLVA